MHSVITRKASSIDQSRWANPFSTYTMFCRSTVFEDEASQHGECWTDKLHHPRVLKHVEDQPLADRDRGEGVGPEGPDQVWKTQVTKNMLASPYFVASHRSGTRNYKRWQYWHKMKDETKIWFVAKQLLGLMTCYQLVTKHNDGSGKKLHITKCLMRANILLFQHPRKNILLLSRTYIGKIIGSTGASKNSKNIWPVCKMHVDSLSGTIIPEKYAVP
jgi:hypothetical protein